jgi:hypothetical protein
MVNIKFVDPTGETINCVGSGIHALSCLEMYVKRNIGKLELTINNNNLSIPNLLKVLKF